MYQVGLTGGIGSGKSTVAQRLAGLGCHVIDADRVAREIVEPGEPALAELAARFGSGILQQDGDLDRSALAAIVFADSAARRELERITHPRIAERIRARLARLDAAGEDRIVVVDHPLLVETGQHGQFDAVVVVTAPEDLRIQRLTARGMDAADARARIAAQTDDETRRTVATHVIANTGTHDELMAEVDRVHSQLVGAASRQARRPGDDVARGERPG